MRKINNSESSIEELKDQWIKKYQGKSLSVLKRDVGGFEVRFNPLRANYMTSTQHADIDTDVFCNKWEAIIENEMIGKISLPHFSWIIATNTSPIEEYHSLLICEDHKEQDMTLECMEDLYAFSLKYPELSIGFNGWKAGASQKHLHAQLFFSELPIMKWEINENLGQVKGYPGICHVFSNPGKALGQVLELAQSNTPSNVLFANGTIFVVPRKSENDSQNVKRGFDSVFGKVPVLTQEDYDQVTNDDVGQILSTLMYQL